jgi:hypothetical protein
MLTYLSRKSVLLHAVLLIGATLPLTVPSFSANAQVIEEPTGAVLIELGGAAGDHLSFNYDVRYSNQLGFRLGMTLDPRELDASRKPGEVERDPDAPYSVLALGHYFVSDGRVTLELGAGPVLNIDGGALSLDAAGHIGVRVQPILKRFFLRVGYSPAIGVNGYRGLVGVGFGYEISGG